MKLKTALASAALATTVFAAPAHALHVGTIPGGTATNDFINKYLGGGTSIEGWYNAQLFLVGGSATFKVEVFGAESGYTNGFEFGTVSFGGSSGYTFSGSGALDASDAIYSSLAGVFSPGLLPFSFTVDTGSGVTGIANGSNSTVGFVPSFFVAFDNSYVFDTTVDGSTAGFGQSVFLFLDDGGINPDDDNHDDFVVRLSIVGGDGGFQVPEPASLGLLGMGLLGIGAARRRRKA